MPKQTYKRLNLLAEDYAFFEDFARKLSEQEGFTIKPAQALRKAVIQYEVRHKLTGQIAQERTEATD